MTPEFECQDTDDDSCPEPDNTIGIQTVPIGNEVGIYIYSLVIVSVKPHNLYLVF